MQKIKTQIFKQIQAQQVILANQDKNDFSLGLNPLGFSNLAVGSILVNSIQQDFFKVIDKIELQDPVTNFIYTQPVLQALCDIEPQDCELSLSKKSYSLAIVIMSDKGYIGQRQDQCAEIILHLMQEKLNIGLYNKYILPDEAKKLQSLVLDLSVSKAYDFIVISGGTGLSPRDQSPEALIPILERRLYGFEQAMMASALNKTPNAILSRAVCGTILNSIIISLPGSPKAVQENLAVLTPALSHAIEKLRGDPSDCGS